MGIWSFCKAARLMRLRAALPSIRTWYNLTLAMVGEMTSGSCLAPPCSWGSQRGRTQLTSPSTCGGALLSARVQLL
jgi:hypothetical protein